MDAREKQFTETNPSSGQTYMCYPGNVPCSSTVVNIAEKWSLTNSHNIHIITGRNIIFVSMEAFRQNLLQSAQFSHVSIEGLTSWHNLYYYGMQHSVLKYWGFCPLLLLRVVFLRVDWSQSCFSGISGTMP